MARDLMQKLRSPTLPRIVRRSLGRILTPRLHCFYDLRYLFEEQMGLELGGPSPFFRPRGLLPIYPIAARIDNCNFNDETIWDGRIVAREGFRYDRRRAPGKQYFSEATNLSFLPDGSYDFLLSSHMLEHSANPLRALHEWHRVLKTNGTLFLIVPHKDGTFDHRRPVTSLQHLIHDFERQIAEDDLTHLPEILQLHDLRQDPGSTSFATFKARSERNLENRALHHHVFDTRLAIESIDRMRFQIRAVELAHPYNIAIVATKTEAGVTPDNGPFLRNDAAYRSTSPFPSDRSAQTHR